MADVCDVNFFSWYVVQCLHCIYPLVFLWVQNGDAMPHHLSKFAAEMHHAHHGTTAKVPAILIYNVV
jgi:hypothetical protein